MEDKELYNPQNGEVIKAKRSKQFWKDWRFYVYTLIAIMLAIVSFSSCLTACAAINAGVGQNQDASYSVAQKKNAVQTTENGYTSYILNVPFESPSTDNGVYSYIYEVSSSFEITLYSSSVNAFSNVTELNNIASSIVSSTNSLAYDNPSKTYFYLANANVYNIGNYGLSTTMGFSIGRYSADNGNPLSNKQFISTNTTYYFCASIDSFFQRPIFNSQGSLRIQLLQNSDLWYQGLTLSDSYITFQDVESYYRELGYQDGYADGNADGYTAGQSAGYASGYSEGLEVGNSNGEANGYADGYAAGLNASNYFKSITANNDLVFFDILANITPYYTDGNGNLYYYRIFSAEVGEDFYYCWLCYYSTVNWSSWEVHLVWCDQSSSSGFTLDYLQNHSLGTWVVPKSNGAFSSVQSYAVYNPAIQTLDNAKVSLVYNVQMMQAYVTLDGGRTYGDVYKDGYTTGYQNGYNYGYELGETAGINAAEPEALTTTLVAVFQQPFNQIYRFFNFNILGLNVLGLATGLLSVLIIIKVFKKVLK